MINKQPFRFFTTEDRELIFSSLVFCKNRQEKKKTIIKLSKQLKRSSVSITQQFTKLSKTTLVDDYASKKLNLGKGTILNFSVNRAVLEDGKITLYID